MRIHLTAAVYVLFFAPFLGVTRAEYAALILTIALVIAAEGFNSAIEMLCDYAQKSYNPYIGKTKDIAAGAVLVCAGFAAIIGFAVLWHPKALWALACAVITSPVYCPLFIVITVLAVVFIIVGPVDMAAKIKRNKK